MSTYQITEEEGRTLIELIESNPTWQVEELYHQLVAEFGTDDEPGPKLTNPSVGSEGQGGTRIGSKVTRQFMDTMPPVADAPGDAYNRRLDTDNE